MNSASDFLDVDGSGWFVVIVLVFISAFMSRWQRKTRRDYQLAPHEWDERLRPFRGRPGERIRLSRKLRVAFRAKDGNCKYAAHGGCSGPLTIDHERSLHDGGTNYSENLRLLCRSHNSQKRERSSLEVQLGVRRRRSERRLASTI
jgi:5-methylcytosine-specific restriction endonuclease McrA